MTFEEHLYFIARIKGVPVKEIKEEIEKVIKMTKTEKERKKRSKQLSGGNKRKLSMCMALIGYINKYYILYINKYILNYIL